MNKDYDLELAVMCAITAETGYVWTQDEIAEVCGISRKMIGMIEADAKRRMWRTVQNNRNLVRELNESRGLDGENRFFLPEREHRRYYVSSARKRKAVCR